MTDYLSYSFNDNPSFIETFDEAPLWSAAFGLFLLKHLELKPNQTIIDLGSGAGFPLLEIASRAGKSCKLYGLDPWKNANERARLKIKNYGLSNVEIIEASAEKIPFEDHSADLIVSNLGINNFENRDQVFRECFRVLKSKGKLVLTTNLNGHWKEFYSVFEKTLRESGLENLVDKLKAHEEHRGTVESISRLFTDAGFQISRQYEEHFEMKFTDGSAFLNHHFVKLGWLGSWKELVPAEKLNEFFSALEENLNSHAAQSGGLTLTVPMAFLEGVVGAK